MPAGVAALTGVLVQIDPDPTVTAHLTLYVNGNAAASDAEPSTGDVRFNIGSVAVSPGQTVTIQISFTATSGQIITLYTVGSPGGSFTAQNSCPDGAASFTTPAGLRAVVSGTT